MSPPISGVTRMTFDDEFNGFSNSPHGAGATWATTYPYGGAAARTLAGNSEAEYYSDSSVGVNPFSLNSGVLSITAAPGWNSAGLPYNSGVITTAASFSQTYGYFEANVRLPAGQGLWPAFWMLPASITYSAELDIFEVLGNKPGELHSTVHGMYGDEWGVVMRDLKVADTSAAFHTYGVDWGPKTTTYYMDGKAIGSAPTPDSMNDPMFMILNLAVGGKGSWPGAPNGATAFPAAMQIDYVRAYATADTTYVGGSAALPAWQSDAVQGSLPAENAVEAPGGGADSIVLSVSEDAWRGDAQFTVSVDGVQQGGVQTATALHRGGTTQQLVINGEFSGAGRVSVAFQNDAYGGSSAADRNLYVDAVSFNGTAMSASGDALFNNGTLNFLRPTGSDTLTLRMAEDAWQGDARARISLDGKLLGTATITAARGAAAQELSFVGNFGRGSHTVGVEFINDAYGGNGADRNLYVQGVSFNGALHAGATAGLYSNGSVELKI